MDRRQAFIAEALSWVGTPVGDTGAIKGPNGLVNCGSLLARSGIDSGIVPPFPLPNIHPRFFLQRGDSEPLLEFITQSFPGTRTVANPQPGDIHLYWFGRHYGHAAIRVSETEIVHAYETVGRVIVSRVDEPLLNFMPLGSQQIPRPVLYLDVLSGLAPP